MKDYYDVSKHKLFSINKSQFQIKNLKKAEVNYVEIKIYL